MLSTTPIGHKIEEERVLWVLHRGDGKAALVKPASFKEKIQVEYIDRLGARLDEALRALRAFLASHPDWSAIWSIPRSSPDAATASVLAKELGGRQLSPDEAEDIRTMGLLEPLGDWGDGSLSGLFELRGDQFA